MTSCRFAVASILAFATSCLGQDRGGVDPKLALPPIITVLRSGHISGSLAYWGHCDFHRSYPDFPKLRILPNYSGAPREVLQEMFADDPEMRVTQEPGGMIRMAETDVPTDLLDVKIRHMSFHVSGPAKKNFHGPNMALQMILMTPEVQAFRRMHNIGPFSDGFLLAGDGASADKPIVYGDLDNVTVSQALDYILQTFPGFWIYENCRGEGVGRSVFFNFFEAH